jgi:transcriptional regulator with XRE-family HTH domain
MDKPTEPADYNFRLKDLRASRGWTLEELSERTGLSKPFLSRLEGGDRQPSIAAVLTLARAFGVPLGSMFEESAQNEPCVIVRAGEATTQKGDGLSYTVLSSPSRFGNLQPMRLTISHRRKGSEQYQHEGEEWLFVLTGNLRVTVAGKQYDLNPGDSAHFDSRQPHRLTALSGRDAEVILVACPLPETDLPRTNPRVRERRAI